MVQQTNNLIQSVQILGRGKQRGLRLEKRAGALAQVMGVIAEKT